MSDRGLPEPQVPGSWTLIQQHDDLEPTHPQEMGSVKQNGNTYQTLTGGVYILLLTLSECSMFQYYIPPAAELSIFEIKKQTKKLIV